MDNWFFDFLVWLVVLATFLAIFHPVLHKMTFGSWEEDLLSEKLNLDRIEGDFGEIVIDKDGGCHQVIELSGHDFAALDEADRERKLWDRESWIKILSESKVKCKIISHKSLHKPQSLNPHTRQHMARADEKWEEQFKKSYELGHYIILSVPNAGDLKALEKAVLDTQDELSDYQPRLLGILPPCCTFRPSLILATERTEFMALIDCPEPDCNQTGLSDTADVCPSCRYDFVKAREKAKEKKVRLISFLLFLVGLGFIG
ncbi:hypothetical protein [Terasakiella sp. SH-1]|uniref:hypothetical protein n=1 Tax=Terasakiella sp. SH-1 TaxID=2560057 RepID=UPI0010741862|nr:hypothetical protein [Terasakiella sp. SH-1]